MENGEWWAAAFSILHSPFSPRPSPFRVHVYPSSADAQLRVPANPFILSALPQIHVFRP